MAAVVHPNGKTWKSAKAGYHVTYAIDIDGKLWGWGRNKYGSLGPIRCR